MDINYIWDFGPLESYPTSSDYTDVVFAVHWKLYASTGSYTAKDYGVQYVSLNTGSTFIPFNELTENIVYGWVTSSIGEEGYNNMTASLITNIENQINPPILIQPVPWAVPQPTTSSLLPDPEVSPL